MFVLCAVFVCDGLQIPVPFNAGSVACRVRLIRMDGCPGGAFYVDVDWAGGKGRWDKAFGNFFVPPATLVNTS